MPRKKETITLSIPPGTKEKLEEIARRLNILWGKDPSVSGLIVAIAQHSVEVEKPFALDCERVNALRRALEAALYAGYRSEAQVILALLLECGNLDSPLRQSLLKLATLEWLSSIEELIRAKQPFYLLYQNSQGIELDYKVRHAQVQFFEQRYYLAIWCDETTDAEDALPEFPELWHNRYLSFDKIRSVMATSGDWRDELDYLKVQLHFYGEQALTYQPKEDDLEDDTIGDVRQVVRRVANPVWLIQECSQYWEDCVIISPESLRARLKQKLFAMCKLYDLEIKY